MHRFLLFLLLASITSGIAHAQSLGDFIEDESELYAETKQINQFIRRFNGEEDVKGERLYIKDRDFRSKKLRKKYLPMLFNLESSVLTDEIKETFIDDVMEKDDPVYLDFHGGDFFAEVKTLFNYKGKDEYLILFLKLQEERVGSKWVISHIHFEPFTKILTDPDTNIFNDSKFLHPMSHEVGFMNIFRIFNDPDSIEYYIEDKHTPDYLSLFLFEIKNNRLKFKTIANVKFHFFQIDNWYFELAYYNRAGYNTGWLISNLIQITKSDKQLLMKYIYHE